jgi:hypothetical protein
MEPPSAILTILPLPLSTNIPS